MSSVQLESPRVNAARVRPLGIGLVKLMGRDSGFIALEASVCSGDVNCLLIPGVAAVACFSQTSNPFSSRRVMSLAAEVRFTMEKLMEFLERRLKVLALMCRQLAR